MALGSLAYVVNDGLIRVATEEGLDVYQALFLRGCGMVAVLATLSRRQGQRIGQRDLQRPLLVRVAAEVVGTAAFFAALVQLEFANAQTIMMLVPFAVTIVAARKLGESVGRQRYVLVTVGFAGVIAVVRPTPSGFSPWALLVVFAAAALVVREFATREVDAETPPLTIALVTAIAITSMMGLISAFTGWGAITMRAAVVLSIACICLIAGYLLLIETVRIGDLSVSAPFRYTSVLGAVVVGIAFFGEVPSTLTIVGCVLIVAAGVLAAHDDATGALHHSLTQVAREELA